MSFKHQSTNPNHTLTLDTRTPVHWQGCGDNQMAGDNTGHFHHKIKKKKLNQNVFKAHGTLANQSTLLHDGAKLMRDYS